tara:strand:- start:11313 stop:11678 length:366 start_codon:yes stop_codon:yes gene_type:complete
MTIKNNKIPNNTMSHTGIEHTSGYWDAERNMEYQSPQKNPFELKLREITREITELLISKNKAYGNTALNPTNVFSKLNATEAICARLDDKLARIKNKGINDETEDTVDDLIGYLLLLKMSM